MGIIPPLNNIENTTRKLTNPRPNKYFLESPYAISEVAHMLTIVPTPVTPIETASALKIVGVDRI
ncbi:hypothetical protein CUZ87_1777 [Enterococcus xinjiangensis]|nr:hypothetical protein [Enterococcus lactis]